MTDPVMDMPDHDDLIPAIKKKQGMRAQGLKPHTRLDKKLTAKSPPMAHAAFFKKGVK